MQFNWHVWRAIKRELVMRIDFTVRGSSMLPFICCMFQVVLWAIAQYTGTPLHALRANLSALLSVKPSSIEKINTSFSEIGAFFLQRAQKHVRNRYRHNFKACFWLHWWWIKREYSVICKPYTILSYVQTKIELYKCSLFRTSAIFPVFELQFYQGQ